MRLELNGVKNSAAPHLTRVEDIRKSLMLGSQLFRPGESSSGKGPFQQLMILSDTSLLHLFFRLAPLVSCHVTENFMTNTAEVYFALHGAVLDPDDVTRIVGLEPTSVTRRADPRPKYSTWTVSSGKVQKDFVDVCNMSAVLVSRLSPFSEKLALARSQLNAEAVFNVVLSITTDDSKPTPAIGFDSNVLQFVVAVGATIDIDTYLIDP